MVLDTTLVHSIEVLLFVKSKHQPAALPVHFARQSTSCSLRIGLVRKSSIPEDFLRRPARDDGQREELLEGELILSPSPKAWHADIVRRLRRQLASLEEKGYFLINDSSCILGEQSIPAPDLEAVKEDRWKQAVANDG